MLTIYHICSHLVQGMQAERFHKQWAQSRSDYAKIFPIQGLHRMKAQHTVILLLGLPKGTPELKKRTHAGKENVYFCQSIEETGLL